MKRIFKIFSISIITSLLASLAISCAAPAPEEPVILRLVIPSPPGDKLTVNAEELAKRFAERTGGKYQIKVYPGEALAKVPEYLDAVRTGAVEMCSIGLGIFAGLDPGLAEIIMFYNNIEANQAAVKPMTELYNEILENKLNQKVVGCYTTGALELISTKPVKTLEDWNGLLVGVGNPGCAAMTTSLGGSPVIVMWTDCYSALEKGVVDAVVTSTQWTIISGLPDVATHVTRFYANPTFNAYTINLDIWNDMSKDTQDILLEEAWRVSDELAVLILQIDKEDKETLTSLGMEVYDLPEAERAIWKEAVRPYVDETLADLGEFGEKIRQIAEEANRANP